MCGWDEGAVYYSDQAQFFRGRLATPYSGSSKSSSGPKEPNVFPYRESLIQNPKFLLVNLSDLLTYDKDQDLRDLLQEAIRLFEGSTMDAAKSGISQQINLTPDIANAIKQAESKIKGKVSIGSHLSERKLIDALTRMGLDELIVRRALMIMHHRDEVEY